MKWGALQCGMWWMISKRKTLSMCLHSKHSHTNGIEINIAIWNFCSYYYYYKYDYGIYISIGVKAIKNEWNSHSFSISKLNVLGC